LDEALDIARERTRKERLFIIGGGSVYEQTITLADELFLTQIQPQNPDQAALFEEEFYGDTFFPQVTARAWELCHASRRYRALSTMRPKPDHVPVKYYFRFFKYCRKSSCGCTDVERKRVQRALEEIDSAELPIRLSMQSPSSVSRSLIT